jgi:hypothetical protein
MEFAAHEREQVTWIGSDPARATRVDRDREHAYRANDLDAPAGMSEPRQCHG